MRRPGAMLGRLVSCSTFREPSMSEDKWLRAAEPRLLLRVLKNRRTDRKRRLFACACCRRVWPLMMDPRSRAAVEVAEQYADGRASNEMLEIAFLAAREAAEMASAEMMA